MAEAIYVKALKADPQNALLRMFVTQHIHSWYKNPHFEMMHIEVAAVSQPFLRWLMSVR